MKVQCSCGAKYEFEVTPEMAAEPVRFVCQKCGLDSSTFVAQLVRQQFATGAPAPEPAASRPAVALHRADTPAAVAPPAVEEVPEAVICAKHPGMIAAERCRVCGKPICPKCMELFGYVCSPHCKAAAERRGMQIPFFEGQKSVVEARLWRKVSLVSAAIGAVAVVALGVWGWYAWVGSQPRVVFSQRFAEPAYSAQTALAGGDQVIALHGLTLARYDLKGKRAVWSRQVLGLQELTKSDSTLLPGLDKEEHERFLLRDAASQLQLRVKGQKIWVLAPEKLILFDFETGKPVQESALAGADAESIERGDELLLLASPSEGKQPVTHWNLATGKSQTEELTLEAINAAKEAPGSVPRGGKAAAGGGLPLVAGGKNAGAPLDPMQIAAAAQALSRPAKIALPALLANSMHQERILEELREPTPVASGVSSQRGARSTAVLLPARDGFVRFGVKLVESRITTRSAMKAKPAKSVLDGELKVTQSTEVANELLNEMQRSRGGDVVQEDHSVYEVSLSMPDGSKAWVGKVEGPPVLHTLDTVNVLTAGHSLYAFSRANQLLWKSELAYAVPTQPPLAGQGPCVEQSGGLFVYDEGVVTAFELNSGAVRWRFPTIGVQGLYFDAQGAVYINTTTASPDKLKFSRQIDISEKIAAEIVKVDERTGKTLWSAHPGGFVAYADEKFVYTVQSHAPEEDESTQPTGFEMPAYTRIRRLDPKKGRELWQYFQDRAPLDVQFNKNSIRLVFKKEVQVVRFLAL